MDRGDWLWGLAALGLIVLFTGSTLAVLRAVSPDVRLHPSFLSMEPLGPGRLWVLAAWAPFFAVNILGEDDRTIAPLRSGELRGHRTVRLPELGHNSVLYSQDTWREVEKALRAPLASPRDASADW